MNNTLKSLMLEWNCLGIWETGIKALADAITVNEGLEVLDLRNCKVSPQGVNMLSLGVKQNKALKALDLRWNSGGLVGGRGLLQSMKHNHTLTNLSLTGNEIPEDLLRAIESCIERNKSHLEQTMKSKLNADFLSSTFQQLAQSHQNTIESLSTKLELSKESAGEVVGKLAAVSKELVEVNEAKRSVDERLKEAEAKNSELGKVVSGLQKEIFNEKEKAMSIEEQSSKTTSSLHMKLKDLETITKDMDLQISVLKKDKSFLVDELDKVKRREKERMDFNQEKMDRLEHAQHRKIQELEADKEREGIEKMRLYEDKIRGVEVQKAKMVDEFDRAKAEFMAEKHRLLDLVSDTEIKIRNDETKRRHGLEQELASLRQLKDKIQDELSVQVSIQTSSLRDHEAELHSLTTSRTALTDQLAKLEHKYSKLQSEHQVVSHENNASLKTIRMQDEKIHGLEAKLEQCHEEIAHLKKSRSKERDHHEVALKEKDEVIAKLREELRRLEEEMENEREDQELRMKEISLQIASVLAQRKKSSGKASK
ncbi:UNVERIFIED_CONTAM: Leucine-rich repeat-containing protein 45 [Siphonaria sp. JEL0065]|nr:Leucine-rich repeat-containing protein 45 [Siphonaria sp. JEL0065]